MAISPPVGGPAFIPVPKGRAVAGFR